MLKILTKGTSQVTLAILKRHPTWTKECSQHTIYDLYKKKGKGHD